MTLRKDMLLVASAGVCEKGRKVNYLTVLNSYVSNFFGSITLNLVLYAISIGAGSCWIFNNYPVTESL